MVARTFKRVSRLRITSVGGPCIDDVFHRKIIGKLIDECEIDSTADSKLNREMDHVDDIRVEPILKNATTLFERKGPDIVEIFSQPRLCQEVAGRSFGGTTLRPGFSLDLTMNGPATGQPWVASRGCITKLPFL